MPVAGALDIATTVGYAVGDSRGVPSIGSYKLRATSLGSRAIDFEDFLNDFISRFKPQIIGLEQPLLFIKAMRNPESRLIAIGLWFEALRICERRGVNWISPNLSEIRSYFLGKNRPKKSADIKAAVIKACVARGLRPNDDNAADAYALWECTVAKTWPQDAMRFALAGMGVVGSPAA